MTDDEIGALADAMLDVSPADRGLPASHPRPHRSAGRWNSMWNVTGPVNSR